MIQPDKITTQDGLKATQFMVPYNFLAMNMVYKDVLEVQTIDDAIDGLEKLIALLREIRTRTDPAN